MTKIWAATEKDVEDLLIMSEAFAKHADLAYNREASERIIRMLIDRGILFRSEKGMIGGTIFPEITSGDLIAQEFFWWSEDGMGKELLDVFENEAARLGAKSVLMIGLANDSKKRMEAIYTQRGYKLAELTYRKEVV